MTFRSVPRAFGRLPIVVVVVTGGALALFGVDRLVAHAVQARQAGAELRDEGERALDPGTVEDVVVHDVEVGHEPDDQVADVGLVGDLAIPAGAVGHAPVLDLDDLDRLAVDRQDVASVAPELAERDVEAFGTQLDGLAVGHAPVVTLGRHPVGGFELVARLVCREIGRRVTVERAETLDDEDVLQVGDDGRGHGNLRIGVCQQ